MNIADQIMRRADRAFAEASGRTLIEDLSPMERKAIEDDMERKARYVRTPAGVRRFKRPIGAIILPRGMGSLDQIRIKDPVFKGFDLVEDRKGNLYDVGKDDSTGKYVALKHNTWDDQVEPQDSLDKALEALNEKLGGGTNSDEEKPAPKDKKPSGPKKKPDQTPVSDQEMKRIERQKRMDEYRKDPFGDTTVPKHPNRLKTPSERQWAQIDDLSDDEFESFLDLHYTNGDSFSTAMKDIKKGRERDAGEQSSSDSKPQGDAPASDDNVASSDPRKRSAKFKRAADNMDRALDAVDNAKTEDDYRRALVDLEKSTVEMEDYIKSKGSEEDFARSALPKIERAKAKARSQIKRMEAKRKDQTSKEPTPTEQARERDAQVQAPFKRDKKTFDDAAAALRKDPKTARESRLAAMEKSIRQREAQLKSPNARRNLTAGMRRNIEEDIARDKKTLHNLRNPQDAPTPEKFIENLLMSDRQSYEALSEKGKAAYRAEIQKHIDKDVHSTNSRYAALRVGQAADRDERARNTFAGNGLREYNKLTEKQKDAVFSDISNLMDPQDALRKQVTGKAPANAQKVARERAMERLRLSPEGQSRYDSSRRSGSTHQEAIDAARAYDRNNNPNWSDATRPKPKAASKGAPGSPERDAFIESHPRIKDVTDYHKPKLRDMSEKNFEAYVAAVEGGKSPNSVGPIMDRIDAGASWNPTTEKWVGQNSTKRPTSPTPTGDTSAADAADAAVRDRVQKMKDADRSKGRTNPYTSSLKPHQKDEVDALTPGEYATYMNARDDGHGHQGAVHRAKNQPKVTYFGALRDADDAITNAKKNLSPKQTPEEQEYELKNRQKRLQEASAELGRHRAALPQKLDRMTSEQKAQEKEILAKYQAIDDAENAILRKRRAVMKKREDLAGQRDRDAAQNQKNREARESAEAAGKFGNTATFVSKNQDLLKEVVTLGRSGKNPAPLLPEVRERLAEIDKRLSWTDDELGGYHKGKGKAESDERAAQFRSTLQSQRERYQKAVDLIESQSKPKGGDKPSSSGARASKQYGDAPLAADGLPVQTSKSRGSRATGDYIPALPKGKQKTYVITSPDGRTHLDNTSRAATHAVVVREADGSWSLHSTNGSEAAARKAALTYSNRNGVGSAQVVPSTPREAAQPSQSAPRADEPKDGPYRRGADRLRRAGRESFTPNQARQVDEMTRDQWEAAQGRLDSGESLSDVLGSTAARNQRDPMAPPPVSRDEVQRRLAERRKAREEAAQALIDSQKGKGTSSGAQNAIPNSEVSSYTAAVNTGLASMNRDLFPVQGRRQPTQRDVDFHRGQLQTAQERLREMEGREMSDRAIRWHTQASMDVAAGLRAIDNAENKIRISEEFRRAENQRVLREANNRQTWANMNDRMGVTMTPAGQAAATAQGDISEFIDQVSDDLGKTRTARAWARDQRNVQRYQEILRSAEEAYANDPNKSNALYNSIQRLRFMVGKQIEKHNPQGVNLRPRKAVGVTSPAYNRTRPAGR